MNGVSPRKNTPRPIPNASHTRNATTPVTCTIAARPASANQNSR